MKKHIIGKVLAALIILVASSFLFSLQGQGEVKFTFLNPDGGDYGNPDGIGGRDLPEQPPEITLEFKVAPNGQVELVSKTISQNADNIRVVEGWSNTNVGNTAYESIRGKSFKLILTSNKRLQCGKDGHGIGCQGTNQRRIDGGTKDNNEQVYFILQGDVGLEFTEIGYRDINFQDGQGHLMIKDHDTKKTWFYENIGSADGALAVTGDYNMRYKSDTLTFSGDPAVGNDNAGGRLLSLEFNVVEPLPKPPAISSIVPERGDSLSFTIADEIELQFDGPMDQAVTSAAVSISPAVTGRVDTWSAEADGDLLTISYDVLTYETWYEIVASAAVKGTNGLNMLAPDTIRFKTLPKPPEVVSTFPDQNEVDIWPNTPVSIEFSKSMIPDSVEKGILFDPPIIDPSYVWSADNKTVFISAGELAVSTMYFVSVSEPAMDDFYTQMEEPYIFVFTTAIATSVENDLASDVVIYPNPASDMLRIEGMDVASLRIYNLSGQMLKEIHNSVSVDVSDIATGLYVVKVSDYENNEVRKMVVIK